MSDSQSPEPAATSPAEMATASAVKPKPPKPRSIVYVDGFNLFYNALKGGRYKWLNLAKLIGMIRNNDDVLKIYYFTALIKGYKQRNQVAYLHALRTVPSIEVVEGVHKEKDRACFVDACTHIGLRVFKTVEEKRTDVSIAVQMLDDAYQDACDILILISGDSDLVPAIERIRQRFPQKEVVVYVPNLLRKDGHHEIREAATREKDLPLNTLCKAQFPDEVSLGGTNFVRRPADW